MKLIHVKTKKPVAEFKKNETKFFSETMQWLMENNGITIPDFLQGEYNNQFVVFLDDPLFQKAFKEIYYDLDMNPEEYVWVE